MSDSKTIFALRRDGMLGDAIKLARKLFSESPDNPWVVRAYGWTLHSLLIEAQDRQQWEQMRELLQEFNGLDVPADDQLLIAKRKEWPGRLPAADGSESVWQIRQRAKEASEAGDYQEALSVYRDGLKSFPDEPELSVGMGWEIPRYLKQLLVSDGDHAGAIRSALYDYERLKHIEKPGVLHSLVLLRAAQAAEKGKYPGIIKFLKCWDPAHLRPDDFNRMPSPDGARDYPGCVAHVIKAIYRTSDHEKDTGLLTWATEFVGEHFERFPEEEWFPYYYGKLLLKSGSLEEAREKILPLVRRKKSEFWVWSCLANTFPVDDPLHLSCLCRALLCRTKDDSFRVNVHAQLGLIFKRMELYGPAKYEIEASLKIRREKNWTVSAELRALAQEDWFTSTAVPRDNLALYRKHAGMADELVVAELPEYPAVISGSIPRSEDWPALTFLACSTGDQIRELRVKTNQHPFLQDMPCGTPLFVRIDEQSEHPSVVAISSREGQDWDIHPAITGLVVQVNNSKGLTVIALSKDEVVLFHHNAFQVAADYKAGDVVEVGLRRDRQHNRVKPLFIRPSEAPLPSRWCRSYDGTFDKRDDQAFGFVRPDIFVTPDLVQVSGAQAGADVSGLAVMEYNDKRKKYGWRAITFDVQPA